MTPDHGDLLADLGDAVVAMDGRLANIEGFLASTPLGGAKPRGIRRRRTRYRLPANSAVRVAQRRQRQATTSVEGTHVTMRVEMLHEIRRFVDALNATYELQLSTHAVPPCWYEHPGAVRELAALMASYQTAYSPRRGMAATDAPNVWHDRVLWPCLRRLREELGLRECVANGGHVARRRKAIVTDSGFDAAIARLLEGAA
ncbi:hypothetical protein QTQ03_28330 [Micromonospora sp. WMMA1363]|uniref:hypothetical protein n=1 Tax=Micromonospora sp. WMMA1363 TaxID=3053985 RepID=UPI00259D3004|nr:hypothetical protein [Micromonospora sp. WMMA1363]MDM4723315.1 hypothetical protein [Micromonospora sp. WMMA1363]